MCLLEFSFKGDGLFFSFCHYSCFYFDICSLYKIVSMVVSPSVWKLKFVLCMCPDDGIRGPSNVYPAGNIARFSVCFCLLNYI
jgi:hypothetical protein